MESGLTALTGETAILLDALGVDLGRRGEAGLIGKAAAKFDLCEESGPVDFI